MLTNASVLVAAFLAGAAVVSAAGPTINTPASLTQCQPILISWQNAQGKAYVTILPGKQISAAPLVSFAPQDASTQSIKWVPNVAAGTAVTLAVSDDTGEKNYSDTVTVLAGTDTSCIKDGASTAADGSTATIGSSSSSGSSSGSSSNSGSNTASSSSAAPKNSASQSASSAPKQNSGASSFAPNTMAMVGSGLAVAAAAVAVFA